MNERKVLTDKFLGSVKPNAAVGEPQRKVVWDAVVPHFGVRVTRKGAKTFFVQKRLHGHPNPVMHIIGRYPLVPLCIARDRARDALLLMSQGTKPPVGNRAAPELAVAMAEPVGGRQLFAKVAEDFISKHTVKNRTGQDSADLIHLYLVPTFGQRAVGSIRRSEVAELLDRIEARQFERKVGKKAGQMIGGPVAADNVLACIRKLFNWHASRDDDFTSPIVSGMARTKPRQRARRRVLTDDEIRALWSALGKFTEPATGEGADPYASLVRCLLLTAQRRDEVAGMARSELHDDVWTIPAERHKTGTEGEPKAVPLSARALEIVGEVPRVNGSDLIFTTNGVAPYSGFSKGKRRLDKLMLAELRALAAARGDAQALARWEEIPRLWAAARKWDAVATKKLKTVWWTLHDLRRTAKTLMARAGVRPDISERVLGHVIGGVEGVYDRYEYLAEKRDALTKLATMVDGILALGDGKIVPTLERDKAA